MKGISEKANHNNKIEQTFKNRSQEIMPEIKRILNLCLVEKTPPSPPKKRKRKAKTKTNHFPGQNSPEHQAEG